MSRNETVATENATTVEAAFNSNYSIPRERWEAPIVGGSVIKDTDNFDVVTIVKVTPLKRSSKTGFYSYELNADGKNITRYLNEGEIIELAKSVNAYRLNEETNKFDVDTDKLLLSIKDSQISLVS